ncbi:conserved hypothetical protein [Ignisphaera aggregans DSM 17230]|uniref:DUF8196 domain-containing protein n=1 Tax=Ignisphaera aggregans (strain DSM 17230 / JCM 13409 / AQ1.S1) TaxID=583356 RepID=E0SPS1_IGNAA|nr:conserved hypothetical protein [Ignisphaera aggregans DSM 17230]
MSIETAELRARLLKLLEEDIEFRYAVAGLIGLGEILKRLDRHEEELKRIWEEIARLREDMNRGFERHDIELAKLREDFNRAIQLFEKRFEEIDKRFEAVEERLDNMNARLGRVERTLEKLTLDIEEEARSIIRYRLRNELGIDIELKSLHLPDMEINIYGCRDDICIVGEASVRASANILEELLDKVKDLRKRYPDKLRQKTILVIYTSLALPELVEKAEKHNIWVLKATGDYYKPDFSRILS